MSQEKESVKINGTLLRVLIQELGLTQTEVAQRLGVSNQTITAWIWGDAKPMFKNYIRLCEVLDIPPKLLAVSAMELKERSLTNRATRFYAREMVGLNEPPDFREVRDIEADLSIAATRDSEEEEVRHGTITVFGESESSGPTEPDSTGSDEEQSA